MGALNQLAILFLLAVSRTASGTDSTADRSPMRQVDRWRPQVEAASKRFGIPADWIRRVMRAESGGLSSRGGEPVTSSAGGMGLMQLMPGTWAEMRALHGLGNDPYDPSDNILAGAAYLRAMYDRFGYPGLFGAYNAGPRRYSESLSGRRNLPAETVAYVAALGPADSKGAASIARRPAAIFVSVAGSPSPAAYGASTPVPPNALFIRLTTAVRPAD